MFGKFILTRHTTFGADIEGNEWIEDFGEREIINTGLILKIYQGLPDVTNLYIEYLDPATSKIARIKEGHSSEEICRKRFFTLERCLCDDQRKGW